MTSRVRFWLAAAALSLPLCLQAQETRGMIYGRVLDPQDSAVVAARVTVTNTDTNVAVNRETNETGYYEATLLLPGNYQVVTETPGFKSAIRSGIVLGLGARLEITLRLELGAVAESITVVGETPLLETSNVTSGRTVTERAIRDLPVMGNQPTLLVQLAPGMYHPGRVTYTTPGYNIANSRYFMPLNVGGNDWTVDGAPNVARDRRVGDVPHADTIQEFRVETSNFDASVGHATGASISMMTKAGTNQFHGTLNETHSQSRWNGSSLFARQLFYSSIAQAEAAGDQAGAAAIRKDGIQPPGHTNSYAASIGGPIVRNRLFFFFSYWGIDERKSTPPGNELFTIPTVDNRGGDFSQLFQVNPTLYQIYDPLTVTADAGREGHYVRQPFANNVIPQSRIVNPAYGSYAGFLPIPNSNPVDPTTQEPVDNWNTARGPNLIDSTDLSNRVDYNISDKHRVFGRWTWADFLEDQDDWTYATVRGLESSYLSRKNRSMTVDYVYTHSSATVLNFKIGLTEFNESGLGRVVTTFKPSDVGLPGYLDEKAGEQAVIPQMRFAGYQGFTHGSYPSRTFYRTISSEASLSHVSGKHSLRAGVDTRQFLRTNTLGGVTSGRFDFDNFFTRRNDDTFTPAGTLGHSWAAFMMGLPTTGYVETNDTYALHSPAYGAFFQDNWRVSSRLTLNLGIRFERENGVTERYDRQLTNFDPTAQLPISAAAQAAYAANPLPELAASAFNVAGGTLYAGQDGAERRRWGAETMWMPRLSMAYQLSSTTVLRVGYGMFYDTLNTLNVSPDQFGYARTTTVNISDDFGQTWLAGDPGQGISPMSDPFPVRGDGTRFDSPVRNSLGLMARAGSGWSYYDFDYKHPRLQRWRVGMQHQLGPNMAIEVGYTGSKATRLAIAGYRDDALPGSYWATGQTRNNDVASDLNANVVNPFNISNFESLQASDGVVYQQMSTLSFFNSTTIRKNQLLRPFPQMNGLAQVNRSDGDGRTDAIEVSFERRFSRGFSLNIAYAGLRGRERVVSLNEFALPSEYMTTQNGRPHRFTFAGIFELPFGKGRAYATSGPLSWILGGWQIASTYEFQPGQLVEFPNLFFSGDEDGIQSDSPTIDQWFNTDGFVRTASSQPAAFHQRVFPLRVDGVRAQSTSVLSANLSRTFRFKERVSFELRGDVLNLMNRSQFNPPNTTPTSTNFGRITSVIGESINRLIQVQLRLRF
jgi:Carboxypeptidase regulatory-like domain/TonB dependent receptor-like, beta-barrel